MLVRKIWKSELIRRCQRLSTKPVPVVEGDEEYENKIRDFERISQLKPRYRKKLPQKPPFMKNVLSGIYDTDILAYPQLEKEEKDELDGQVTELQRFVEERYIEEYCGPFVKEILPLLGNQRLIGLQVNQLFGGRELGFFENCRFLDEIYRHPYRVQIAHNESFVLQAINRFGTDSQKIKYLPKLLGGDVSGAFCVPDPLDDVLPNKYTPLVEQQGKQWVLSGKREHVLNAAQADIFIVYARSEIVLTPIGNQPTLTAFIVERDHGVGTQTVETICGHGDVADVYFRHVEIPAENLLGEENGGEKMLNTLIPEYWINSGLCSAALMRQIINKTVEHALNMNCDPNNKSALYDTDAVRNRIALMCQSLYAVESMNYLTAGLVHHYEDQDVELEAAINRVFASQAALNVSQMCLNFVGPAAMNKDHWAAQFHLQAQLNAQCMESLDDLKIILILFALRYAGKQMQESVKKLRNPLDNASFVIRQMLASFGIRNDNPRLTLKLDHYLHPSLCTGAETLEYAVIRTRDAVRTFLTQYGHEALNQHVDLSRLAQCLIDIYTMTACLGRASRSYCIGLQHADMEVRLVGTLCNRMRHQVRINAENVENGRYFTADDQLHEVARDAFSNKCYFPVHPLSRNF